MKAVENVPEGRGFKSFLGWVVRREVFLCSTLCWAIPPVRLGLSRRNSGKIPERPRKRSQSVSWNSPREYGWDTPSPIIQGIWGFQSISRILSPPVRLGTPLFSEVVPERDSQSRSWNSQQYWGYFWIVPPLLHHLRQWPNSPTIENPLRWWAGGPPHPRLQRLGAMKLDSSSRQQWLPVLTHAALSYYHAQSPPEEWKPALRTIMIVSASCHRPTVSKPQSFKGWWWRSLHRCTWGRTTAHLCARKRNFLFSLFVPKTQPLQVSPRSQKMGGCGQENWLRRGGVEREEKKGCAKGGKTPSGRTVPRLGGCHNWCLHVFSGHF